MEFSDEKENQTEQDECAAEADDQVRIKSSLLSKNKLLFVHQTKWQKRLLNKYGNELTLPDATYKTTRYAFPLFFFSVGYQVVGSFVIQDECASSIREALHIIHQWNPHWNPAAFMTDYCEQEKMAVMSQFPGRELCIMK